MITHIILNTETLEANDGLEKVTITIEAVLPIDYVNRRGGVGAMLNPMLKEAHKVLGIAPS